MIKQLIAGIGFYFLVLTVSAQILKPGFDTEEFRQMILISMETNTGISQTDSGLIPVNYRKLYRSDTVGMENLWELWRHRTKKLAVISVRGTTEDKLSWFANYYMAMYPAKGKLKIAQNRVFKYELSDSPKAAVHAGWLLSLGFLSDDIVEKIKAQYDEGVRDFILTGHSQGGAITYLLTAYLEKLKQKGVLPDDLRFKTYCIAAPKPGNLYFAYHFDELTQFGWGFNVINTEDWVPETPFSIQTFDDFNEVNPFEGMKNDLKNQKFPKNIILMSIYKKIRKGGVKAQKLYIKYFGGYLSKMLVDDLIGFEPMAYYPSLNYMRAGTAIILKPDSGYYDQLTKDKTDTFRHHHLGSYLYLLDHLQR